MVVWSQSTPVQPAIQEQAHSDFIINVGKQRGKVQLYWVNQAWIRSGQSSTLIKTQSHSRTTTLSVLFSTLEQYNQL